ncbi:MAG: DedA family protein [Rhodothermales bacterium]
MGEQVIEIIESMRYVAPLWAYVLLVFVAYMENVVPPLPGDLAVVFGGYLVGVGHLSFPVVVAVASLGGVLGFMTMFLIGRRVGDAVLDPHRLRWLPKKKMYNARLWLLKWGYLLVGVNRFASGLRSVISLTVGAAKMEVWKTALFSTFSAVAWTGLITYLGMLLGENWAAVSDYLRAYGRAVTVVVIGIIAFVAGRVVWSQFRR